MSTIPSKQYARSSMRFVVRLAAQLILRAMLTAYRLIDPVRRSPLVSVTYDSVLLRVCFCAKMAPVCVVGVYCFGSDELTQRLPSCSPSCLDELLQLLHISDIGMKYCSL